MSRKYNKKAFPKFQVQDIDGQNALGVVVICSLEGIKEQRDVLAQKMISAGLNPQGIVAEKKAKSAFIDALKSLEEAKILLKVEDTGDYTTYQTNSSSTVAGAMGNELEVHKSALVRLYKKGTRAGEVESDVPGVGERVKAMLDNEKNIARTRDVSAFLRRMIEKDADAINLTPAGVSWFFQPGYYTMITRLEAFIGSLNGQNFFQAYPIGVNAKNRGTYWKSIIQEIDAELKFLDSRIKEAEDKISLGEEPTQMLATLLAQKEEKAERLQAYADLFQLQSQELNQKLIDQNNRIVEMLAISSEEAVSTPVQTPAETPAEDIQEEVKEPEVSGEASHTMEASSNPLDGLVSF